MEALGVGVCRVPQASRSVLSTRIPPVPGEFMGTNGTEWKPEGALLTSTPIHPSARGYRPSAPTSDFCQSDGDGVGTEHPCGLP